VYEPTPSRASLAPTGFVSSTESPFDTKPVGARLAREETVSLNTIAESKLFSSSPITFGFSFGT
jgi:hypothetical protein